MVVIVVVVVVVVGVEVVSVILVVFAEPNPKPPCNHAIMQPTMPTNHQPANASASPASPPCQPSPPAHPASMQPPMGVESGRGFCVVVHQPVWACLGGIPFLNKFAFSLQASSENKGIVMAVLDKQIQNPNHFPLQKVPQGDG